MAELAAVASIIQIADVGFRLSVNLCTFAETVASADKAIIFTSKDVSLTSSVLREVGEVLKKDRSFRTYSPEAIKTATAIVTECSDVFQEMDRILTEKVPNINSERGKRGSKATMTLERFKCSYWQPKIQLLRSNLDKLRSTFTDHASVHANQIALIRDLIASKERHIRKYEKLKRSITGAETTTSKYLSDSDESPTLSTPDIVEYSRGPSLHNREIQRDALSATDLNEERETKLTNIHHLMSLFKRLIIEVNTPSYQIGLLSRDRIRHHVYEARSGEISQLYQLHGKTVVDQTLKVQVADLSDFVTPADHPQTDTPKQKRRREDRENSAHSRKTRRGTSRRRHDSVVPSHHEESTPGKSNQPRQIQDTLEEFFVDGEEIHREVLQSEICKYLGPDAYFRPAAYLGGTGYMITAYRTFTPMLDDLIKLSTSFAKESREINRSFHQPRAEPPQQLYQVSDDQYSYQPGPSHSGSALGHFSGLGNANPSTGGYRDPRERRREYPRADPRDPRMDPRDPTLDLRDLRMDPRDPRMDPRDPRLDTYPDPRCIPSYSPYVKPPKDISMHGAVDDPRSYDYVSSISPLQSGGGGSFTPSGNAPRGYDPRDSPQMRYSYKPKPTRKGHPSTKEIDQSLRNLREEYERIRKAPKEDDVTESRPVHDINRSTTIDAPSDLIMLEAVEGEDNRSSVPNLHSNEGLPRQSIGNFDAYHDQVTEWEEPTEELPRPKRFAPSGSRPTRLHRRSGDHPPLRRHEAYDNADVPAEYSRPESNDYGSRTSSSPSSQIGTSEERMKVDTQTILEELLVLWKPVAKNG